MTQHVIGFLIIFGSSLAGYAGSGPWAVALAALGLLALSYAERQSMSRRLADLGADSVIAGSMATSAFNAVCATGAAYAFGVLLRLL